MIESARSAWDIVKIARHPQRPLFLDYVNTLFTEFDILYGDRLFGDDQALIGGLARFNGRPVMVIGHHKGHNTRQRIHHNFGMTNPEGYRKSHRLLKMAERFGLPVMTFIDTPGAYPGVGAEERGQSEAIAQNLALLSSLKVPVIATIIGEGGSGGALALGVADYVNMLENSIYSVISPEGCAAILWKTSERAAEASEALGLTAKRLQQFGLVDEIILEGVGAHEDPTFAMNQLAQKLEEQLEALEALDAEKRCLNRYQKLMSYNSTLSSVMSEKP